MDLVNINSLYFEQFLVWRVECNWLTLRRAKFLLRGEAPLPPKLRRVSHTSRNGYRWVLSNDGLVISTGNPKKLKKKNYYTANLPRISKNHAGMNKKLCNEKSASNRPTYSTTLIRLTFKKNTNF
jgi:hypothetical protein